MFWGSGIRQTNILRTASDRMATNSCVSEKPVLGGKKAEQILADEQNIEQINNQQAAYSWGSWHCRFKNQRVTLGRVK